MGLTFGLEFNFSSVAGDLFSIEKFFQLLRSKLSGVFISKFKLLFQRFWL